jgi:hypothetical protein
MLFVSCRHDHVSLLYSWMFNCVALFVTVLIWTDKWSLTKSVSRSIPEQCCDVTSEDDKCWHVLTFVQKSDMAGWTVWKDIYSSLSTGRAEMYVCVYDDAMRMCVCVLGGGGVVMCGCFGTLTEVSLTLTEVFPCFFFSCKANARVKLTTTGHGQNSSILVVICVVRLLFVLFYVLFVCKCVLPPGDNPTAVNIYVNINIFVNCNWVDTRWQHTFAHKQYIEQHK